MGSWCWSRNAIRWGALTLALCCSAAFGVTSETPTAKLLDGAEEAELKRFGTLDLDALAAEDTLTDELPGWPRRYAVPRKVTWTPADVGTWSQALDGRWIWRLRVRAKDAAHLNFGFRRFALPPGAALHVVSTDGRSKIGPFTAAHML
ncbi:MAG: hypothetical protein AAGE01_24090, partial [Pseudomonadota bacterium]